jgi:hypothetical protein
MFVKIETPLSTCKSLTLLDKAILADTLSFYQAYANKTPEEQRKDQYKGGNAKSTDNYAWQFGMGNSAVQRSIGKLDKLGLITKQSGVSKAGGWRIFRANIKAISNFVEVEKKEKPNQPRLFTLSVTIGGDANSDDNITEASDFSGSQKKHRPMVETTSVDSQNEHVNYSIKKPFKITVTTTPLTSNGGDNLNHIKNLICKDLGLTINNEVFSLYDICHEWAKRVFNVDIPEKPNTTVIKYLIDSDLAQDGKAELVKLLDNRYQHRNVNTRREAVNLSWLLGLGGRTFDGSNEIEDVIIKNGEIDDGDYWSSKETAELYESIQN